MESNSRQKGAQTLCCRLRCLNSCWSLKEECLCQNSPVPSRHHVPFTQKSVPSRLLPVALARRQNELTAHSVYGPFTQNGRNRSQLHLPDMFYFSCTTTDQQCWCYRKHIGSFWPIRNENSSALWFNMPLTGTGFMTQCGEINGNYFAW